MRNALVAPSQEEVPLSVVLPAFFDFLPGKTQTCAGQGSGCVVLTGKIKIPKVWVPPGEESSLKEPG